jgi:cyclic-di-GMP phosphodiesterase TipF (flagellum assembly factor)
MGRLSAIFIAFCMVLIAISIGIVTYLSFGFTGMEASVIATAVLTALVMMNSLTGRTKDRGDLGGQIADLSRGTADMARQVSELDRRLVALENDVAIAIEKTRSSTAPLQTEIGELGELVKDLADAVSAHEQMLESAIRSATPARLAPAPAVPVPVPAPPYAPAAYAPAPPYAPPAQPYAPEPQQQYVELTEPVQQPPMAAPKQPMPTDTGYFRGRDSASVVAELARTIEANRIDLYLQPIVTLPQRKVRYYEALTRLRADDGTLLAPADFQHHAENSGLLPAIDNLMTFRSVQVVRRLTTKNREVGLFCSMSVGTLTNATVFKAITDFLEANRTLAPYIVFEFNQSAVREMGPIEEECVASLADLGFRFSLNRVTDLRMEPRELAERGFRFVKVPAPLLLSRTAAPQGDIHPQDFSDLLGRFGIDLIAEQIESEGAVVDLLDYDVRFGQGTLFSPPRPVRTEVLQGAQERPPERAPAPPPPQPRAVDRPAPPSGEAPQGRVRGPGRDTAIAEIARGIARRAQGGG